MRRLRMLFEGLTRKRETRWTFTAVIGVLYAVYLAWAHAHHELWRDEIHSWTLARMAEGFGDVVTGDRVYEGHPPLWFWYLRVWSRFTDKAWGLHAASATAMAVAGIAFLRHAPFARVLKVLLLCSYLLGYEYGVLSRNYSLDWLLMVAFCCTFDPLRPRYWLSTTILALLSVVSAYGVILAASLFIVLARTSVSISVPTARPRRLEFTASPRILPFGILLLCAIAFSFRSSIPPDPNPFSPAWNLDALNKTAFEPAVEKLVYAFLPVRIPGDINCWSTPWAFWGSRATLRLWCGAGLILLLCVSLWPSRSALLAFIFGVGAMSLVQTVRYGGSMRHWGHAVLLYVVLCWASRRMRPARRFRLSSFLLLLIALFQVESWWVAVQVDRTTVFSGAEATARYIERAGLQDLPIVAGPDWFVISVTGYLRRYFVSVETGEYNQTVVFHSRRRGFSDRALVERAATLAEERHGPVLLLSNARLPAPVDPGRRLRHLYQSPDKNMADGEQFFVYELD